MPGLATLGLGTAAALNAHVRPLLITAGLLIVLGAVKLASPVLTPLILALTLAVSFHPMSERLTRRGAPPWFSAVLTTMAILAAVLSVGALLMYVARDLAIALPDYLDRFDDVRRQLGTWFDRYGLHHMAKALRSVDPGGETAAMVQAGLSGLTGLAHGLVLVLVLTVFIQLEGPSLARRLARHLAEPGDAERADRALKDVQRYLAVKGALSLANGVLLGLWCHAWGVDNPLAWGVLAFLLNFVPVIGSIVAAVPPVLLSWADGGLGTAMGVATGYLAVNLLVDNLLEPRIMGRTAGLSPLSILLAMAFWGFLLGPIGALLSVPLTGAARLACERVPELRWVSVLLAADGSRPLPSART